MVANPPADSPVFGNRRGCRIRAVTRAAVFPGRRRRPV